MLVEELDLVGERLDLSFLGRKLLSRGGHVQDGRALTAWPGLWARLRRARAGKRDNLSGLANFLGRARRCRRLGSNWERGGGKDHRRQRKAVS